MASRDAAPGPPLPDANDEQTDARDDITVVRDGAVCRVTMARPARRNALSRTLVAELGRIFAALGADDGTRVVVLGGEGPVFCAGGDIAEFGEAAAAGRSRGDAEGLADLLAAMAACPAPVVARVQGAAYGGGVGLVCAADIAIVAEGTRFALSEARLGLVPAVIAPYVIAALGAREAKTRMLLAAPFGVADALRSGLIHRVVPPNSLDAAVEEVVVNLLRGAPAALASIKRLPDLVAGNDLATRAATTGLLVDRLASDEGQEGLRAFLEKRPPTWEEDR